MSDRDVLIWIDCEMTGLDPQLHDLVEVAVIATDSNLKPLDDGIDVLIKPSAQGLAAMDDFVRQMHTNSGLLAELENAGSREQACAQVMAYIRSHVSMPGKALLAGNSVGMDKAFLAAQMPEVTNYLHYRLIDVSSIKELARRWYPRAFFNAPKKEGGHRALADIQESILELEYYRRILFPADSGPSSEQCAQVSAGVTWENLTS